MNYLSAVSYMTQNHESNMSTQRPSVTEQATLGTGEGNQIPMQGPSGLLDITKDIARECIAVTERFCDGRITKAEAIVQLYKLIPGCSEYEPFIRALNTYICILNSFKESWHKARN